MNKTPYWLTNKVFFIPFYQTSIIAAKITLKDQQTLIFGLWLRVMMFARS